MLGNRGLVFKAGVFLLGQQGDGLRAHGLVGGFHIVSRIGGVLFGQGVVEIIAGIVPTHQHGTVQGLNPGKGLAGAFQQSGIPLRGGGHINGDPHKDGGTVGKILAAKGFQRFPGEVPGLIPAL